MASDPQTWAELKTAIANWLNRDDLTAEIPEFIAYAERRLNRVLIVPDREATATITADAETEALPADFWEARSLYLDQPPRAALDHMPLSELRTYYAAGDTGRPRHFAIQSGTTLVLGPIPSGSFSLKLNYYQTIPALGASQATNWLLTKHPDLYVAETLHRAFTFLRDAEGMAIHRAVADSVINELTKAGERAQNGASPMRARSGVFNWRGT